MYFYSLLPLANILCGFILAAPLIERLGLAAAHVKAAREKVHPMRNTIGIIELVLGVLFLFNQLSFIGLPYYFFGTGYLQSILGIVQGLLIAKEVLKAFPGLYNFVAKFETYQEYVGVVGILGGLSVIF